jgi:hypothetical protein
LPPLLLLTVHEVVAAGAADVVDVDEEPEVTSRPPTGAELGFEASFAFFAAFRYAASVWVELGFTTPLMPLMQ